MEQDIDRGKHVIVENRQEKTGERSRVNHRKQFPHYRINKIQYFCHHIYSVILFASVLHIVIEGTIWILRVISQNFQDTGTEHF